MTPAHTNAVPAQSNALTYVKLMLMAFFWGGTFIAGRLLALEATPFSAAFLRFAIASTALLILTRKHCGWFPRIKPDQRLPLFLLGLSGIFAYNAFFFTGLRTVEAGRAAVIIANNPIFIGLFAALIFKEKLTPTKLFGIALSILGAVVVITKGAPATLFANGIGLGELLIFGCVISWTTYSLIGRVAMSGFSPLVAVTYSSLIGTVLLLPAALADGLLSQVGHYSTTAWASLLFAGLCGTVLSFVWYYQGIQRIGSMRAGQFINFVPVSAVLLSIVILGEPLTDSLMIGLALVSGGVYIANSRR